MIGVIGAGIGGASQVLIPISGNGEKSAGKGGGCVVRGLDIRIPFRQPGLAAAAGHGGA